MILIVCIRDVFVQMQQPFPSFQKLPVKVPGVSVGLGRICVVTLGIGGYFGLLRNLVFMPQSLHIIG